MRAVVLYESLFGNTRRIAHAVAEGVATAWPDATVDCFCVDATDQDFSDADLLIVGAPTHFWGLTSRISRALEHEYELRIRRADDEQGDEIRRRSVDTHGARARLATIAPGRGTAAAAFDTRMDRTIGGGAAPGIARRLGRRGYRLVAEPKAFIVAGIAGPLPAGQLQRANQWAQQIARSLGSRPEVSVHPSSEVVMNEPTGTKSLSSQKKTDGALAHRHSTVDVTRVLTTAEVVVGAVLVARILAGRPSAPRAQVTMGPGGWISMKGGSLAVRPARRPWGRPRPLLPPEAGRRAPLWARVLSAVPLQALVNLDRGK
jgi:hypothetical protein